MNDVDYLDRFMQGMAAAAHLLNKAIEKRSALECIVLQASLIDGSLRVGLILRKQLQMETNAIDITLLKQADGDQKISERTVYQRCRDTNVIDEELLQALSEAYEKRNKCIHRYLLSEINYDFATSLVFELDALLDRVRDVIWCLEKEQIDKGVGMTVNGSSMSKELLREYASRKEKSYNLGS